MYKIILKQQIVLFGFLLILCAVLSGCTYQEQSSEQKASPFPVVINHITLYGEPESVVSLADPITEALQSLGFSDKLAGINTDCELEGLDELPAAGTAEQPDITAILEIGPDLLITNIPLPTGTWKNYQRAASRCWCFPRTNPAMSRCSNSLPEKKRQKTVDKLSLYRYNKNDLKSV